MTTNRPDPFSNVDPRFDVQPRKLLGPFWTLTVVDTWTGRQVPVRGGGCLTGFGSVGRAAHFATKRYLAREAS